MYKIVLTLLLVSITLFAEEANYVGDKACISCHKKEHHEWKGSHHDLAMQVADEHSVKADFNNTTFNYNGIISTFYKKDGKFMVNTDGLDGKLHDYEIAYTFGVYPLQQYMIKFPDGKVQVLDPTWDSRSKKEGGERWFHIHKDDNVTAGDPLHWTGPNMNWNFMCADCHSTNLKKNYDTKTKSYHTTWDVINVSCEACHGPASNHLKWAKNPEQNLSNHGFLVTLLKKGRVWSFDEKTDKPILHEGNVTNRYHEIEVCAKCHARRSQLDDDFKAGDKFQNHYLPVQLTDRLYFSDGKIKDEVYVYDSFLQSKMYAKGVTCTDCHNPHTLERKAEGDNICFKCHTVNRYKSPTHHHHKADSKGGSCITCHMPPRTYMGVDSRNDHSFRVPRPDISVEMPEIPNACNLCHKDKDANWSTKAMKKWYGKIPLGGQNFAHSMKSLKENLADAPKELYKVLMGDAPDIAKATAVAYLGHYPSKQTYTTTLQMLRDDDGAIRLSALRALESFPPKMRIKEIFKLLNDPLKTVRTEAVRQLSYFSMGELDKESKVLFEKVLAEYKESLLFNAERPESQLALALFYANKNMPKKVEESYHEALRLQPMFAPAYINYSDFLRKMNRDKEAYEILKKGLKKLPNIASLHYSLGLWYVRAKESKKAIEELKKAVELEPNNARFAYVYAVALGKENPKKAVEILESIYAKHTGNREVVGGLVYYYKEIGEERKSQEYQKILKSLQNFSVR